MKRKILIGLIVGLFLVGVAIAELAGNPELKEDPSKYDEYNYKITYQNDSTGKSISIGVNVWFGNRTSADGLPDFTNCRGTEYEMDQVDAGIFGTMSIENKSRPKDPDEVIKKCIDRYIERQKNKVKIITTSGDSVIVR